MKSIKEVRILVVDDYEINLQVMLLSLKRLSVQAEISSNGARALEMYKIHPYQLVFMDLMMPEMDGYTSVNLIRQFEAENDLKPSIIIAVSANQYTETTENLLNIGFDSVLAKPFILKDLKAILKNFFTDVS